MGFAINPATKQMTITRGDSGALLFTLKMDGAPYEMQEGDKIQFGVKQYYEDAECLIEKEYTENPFALCLVPGDTKDLEFGSYKYDMQFVAANGFTRTFLEKKTFRITEEVV